LAQLDYRAAFPLPFPDGPASLGPGRIFSHPYRGVFLSRFAKIYVLEGTVEMLAGEQTIKGR
jgi:hypothetical protein